MPNGAIYSRTSNFSRWPKPNIVYRMRKMIASKLYERPKWMTTTERAPPLELHSLSLNSWSIRNPYPSLVHKILKKYPNLRFQDCFVYGNNWEKGLDRYRDDHPVMQFAAHQLDLINRGFSEKESFSITEKLFYERRMNLEKEQKINMALNTVPNVAPMFTSAQAYWHADIAKRQKRTFLKILAYIKDLREYEELKKIQDKLKKKNLKTKINGFMNNPLAMSDHILSSNTLLDIKQWVSHHFKNLHIEDNALSDMICTTLNNDTLKSVSPAMSHDERLQSTIERANSNDIIELLDSVLELIKEKDQEHHLFKGIKESSSQDQELSRENRWDNMSNISLLNHHEFGHLFNSYSTDSMTVCDQLTTPETTTNIDATPINNPFDDVMNLFCLSRKQK